MTAGFLFRFEFYAHGLLVATVSDPNLGGLPGRSRRKFSSCTRVTRQPLRAQGLPVGAQKKAEPRGKIRRAGKNHGCPKVWNGSTFRPFHVIGPGIRWIYIHVHKRQHIHWRLCFGGTSLEGVVGGFSSVEQQGPLQKHRIARVILRANLQQR